MWRAKSIINGRCTRVQTADISIHAGNQQANCLLYTYIHAIECQRSVWGTDFHHSFCKSTFALSTLNYEATDFPWKCISVSVYLCAPLCVSVRLRQWLGLMTQFREYARLASRRGSGQRLPASGWHANGLFHPAIGEACNIRSGDGTASSLLTRKGSN